jgi:RND family efflux transporter MFP subunit
MRASRIVRKSLLVAALAAVVVVLMLALMRTFSPKVSQASAGPQAPPLPAGMAVHTVAVEMVPAYETAVGTLRPVYEAAVASKIFERVADVDVRAGQAVKKGQVLVRLDDSLSRARLQQSQAAEAAAAAARDQAKTRFDAIDAAFKRQAATKMEYDTAANELRSAEANVLRAQQAVVESKISFEFTVVASPMDGVVIDKKVNPGDTVAPGQVLVTLYDPTRMQLVASVRESLAQRLTAGQGIDVRIESLGIDCHGQVSEIVPEAQAATRTFSVKVTGPCHPGVYAGVWGRMYIPLGSEAVLAAPRQAVRRYGQIDMVEVVRDGRLYRRAVQLGEPLGASSTGPASASAPAPASGRVRVLAGLRAGEQVAVPEAQQ